MAALNENAVHVAWMAMDGLFHDVFIVRGMMLLIYTDLNATDVGLSPYAYCLTC